MPARRIDEINISNVIPAGGAAKVDRYNFDIEIKWTDLQGGKHTHADTYIWPSVLDDVPNNVVKQFMQEMIIIKVRVELGLSSWEDYG